MILAAFASALTGRNFAGKTPPSNPQTHQSPSPSQAASPLARDISLRQFPPVPPFQIIFNPTSAAELAKLPKDLQLHVLGEFRGLPRELQRDDAQFGHLSRNNRTLTRYRLGDYRVYFERHPLGIVVHRILSKHTLKDFLFRSNLAEDEDGKLQDNPKFWELIEQTKVPAKKAA